MKANLKPANAKARELLKKLQALAERGIDGEKTAAQAKLARLKARFDFGQPHTVDASELFSGSFQRASKARRICSFKPDELDVANSVKWAIEAATKIPCVWRNGDLMAEASPATITKLAPIAEYIAQSFRTLLQKFGAIDGVNLNDRAAFVMGLYDGMMNETRDIGQRLPGRTAVAPKTRKAKKAAVAPAPGLHVHPYTVALGLGKQIRFSVSVEKLSTELEEATRKPLAPGESASRE